MGKPLPDDKYRHGHRNNRRGNENQSNLTVVNTSEDTSNSYRQNQSNWNNSKENYYGKRGRGRGGGDFRRRGPRPENDNGNYDNNVSSSQNQSQSSAQLILPQDKYSNKGPSKPGKPKEKMSARWQRIQGSDSDSDSEDTESDSSDS